MNQTPQALQVRDLTITFGGLVAVDRLKLDVGAGQIHSVIGPNGAGKSSLLNAITGLGGTLKGSVRLFGEEVLGLGPHKIAARGAARTFQNTELFHDMSVLENVLVGAHREADYGLLSAALRTPRFRRLEKAALDFAESVLVDVGLANDRHLAAGTLPFGKQRLLEIARALATRPRIIFLDEPAAGLRAIEVEQLNMSLVKLRDERRMTILLIDHVMPVVMKISDVVTVLNFGRKIGEGEPKAVANDPEVRRAYLGSSSARVAAN